MTNDGLGNTYSYDAESRVTSMSGTNSAAYVYDAFGQRVRSTINSTAYDFIYNGGRAIDEVNGSSWVWGHPGSARNITYTSSSTYFDHADWLGTVRARSNVSGASAETCTSLPFGDALSCSGTDYSPLHYTGQPLDSESNLHHFLFRQLSTTQGRWATCDPTGLGAVDPTDPQTWNRYAYVSNSPTGFVDPLGAGVNKPYTGTFNCNTDAAGIMQQIESNFSQFGQYNGEFGPLGVPAASAAVTFGTGSATPVVQGGSIPISAVIEGPTPIPVFGYKVNVSVTVASVSPNSFTFNTDPGHVLYPASITFSASDASNGQIDFSIQVNGDFSGKLAEAEYYTGGYNLENKIWTNFINNVKAACAKSTKRKTGGSKPPAGGGGGSTPQPVAGG